jgi:hypothetical protein
LPDDRLVDYVLVPMTGGSDRRAEPARGERSDLLFATVAEKRGMTHDPGSERMSTVIGAVTLVVTMHQRGGEGSTMMGTLRWPAIGIDLRARRRTWSDFGAREFDLGTSPAAQRFTADAREPAQGRAVLRDEALRALASFEDVRIDDDGAVVTSPGGATLEQLDAFTLLAILAARALAFRLGEVPPPASMAASLANWIAFAAHLGGDLHPGAMRITTTSFGPDAIEIETLWSRDGVEGTRVEGTAVRVHLSPSLDDSPEVDGPETSAESRELAEEVRSRARAVRLTASEFEAITEGPIHDPSRLEPLLERLVALARSFRRAAGPYR